jgi:uncharacterized membrane protein
MPNMPDVLPTRSRQDGIDFVRGAVMILMLLDHTRDFTHEAGLLGNPLDPATTTPLLYMTRWITHLCAPAFVLLAGLGVGLKRLAGTEPPALATFVLKRGLWLIALELVVVRVLIWFNLDLRFLAQLQVIWAIGASMVVLSLLVRLPAGAVLTVGLALVFGHNLLDAIRFPPWGGPESPLPSVTAKLWFLLHQGGFFPIAGFPSPIVWAHYPILPWLGIMATGYGLSLIYAWPQARRRQTLIVAATVMVVLFLALRSGNIYGEPRPWTPQGNALRTAMSFFDVTKYGPSLLFALITHAPALFTLAWLDGRTLRTGVAGAIVTFGRVPLFFYLLQWPTAHIAGILVSLSLGKSIGPYFYNILDFFQIQSLDIGGPLWMTYVCWIAGVLLLYWPCRWFARIKASRRDWWLSYL